MKHSEVVKELNKGVVVKHGKVSESLDLRETRLKIQSQYTGMITYDDATVGVRPVIVVEPFKLDLEWEISAVRSIKDQLTRIPFEHMRSAEMDAVRDTRILFEGISDDTDIDDFLNDLDFEVHQRG